MLTVQSPPESRSQPRGVASDSDLLEFGDVQLGGGPAGVDWWETWDVADFVLPSPLDDSAAPRISYYPVRDLWFVTSTATASGFGGDQLSQAIQRAAAQRPRAVVCVLRGRRDQLRAADRSALAATGRLADIWPAMPIILSTGDPDLAAELRRRRLRLSVTVGMLRAWVRALSTPAPARFARWLYRNPSSLAASHSFLSLHWPDLAPRRSPAITRELLDALVPTALDRSSGPVELGLSGDGRLVRLDCRIQSGDRSTRSGPAGASWARHLVGVRSGVFPAAGTAQQLWAVCRTR